MLFELPSVLGFNLKCKAPYINIEMLFPPSFPVKKQGEKVCLLHYSFNYSLVHYPQTCQILGNVPALLIPVNHLLFLIPRDITQLLPFAFFLLEVLT